MRKTISLLALISVGIISGLVLAELFLRINPAFGYKYSFCRFENKDRSDIIRVSFDAGYLRPSALLGYEIIPNCRNNLPVPSNSHGLIGREYKLIKDKDTFRILLLGDSVVWDDLLRQYLEKKLNSAPPPGLGSRFEIWNASCPSYDLRRYYVYLRHRGLYYGPDMVIIALFMNDACLNINLYYKDKDGNREYYFPIPEISRKCNVSPFLMKHSYLYRFVILSIDSYLAGRKMDGDKPKIKADAINYLRMIKDICADKKIGLLVVVFPYLKPLDEYDNGQILEYRAISEALQELEIIHINLYDDLSVKNLHNLRNSGKDEIHPGPEGHAIISEVVYDFLLKNPY